MLDAHLRPLRVSTQVEFMISLRRNAMTSSRSVSTNGVILCSAGPSRSDSRTSAVQSTCTLTVAAGISLCDKVILSAIRAWTP